MLIQTGGCECTWGPCCHCTNTLIPGSGYFAQHHVDNLIPTMSPVQLLAHKFPGKTEQEYRSHLGNFQITGMTGLQSIATLSGGQKSRVAFSVLSMQKPHVLLLDEARIPEEPLFFLGFLLTPSPCAAH